MVFCYRLARNAEVERESEEECSRALSVRLESQVFHGRNPSTPTTVALHPYESLLAVSGKDYFGYANKKINLIYFSKCNIVCFSVWDWQQGSKVCYCSNRNARGARITSLHFLNGREAQALLLVGADDGTLKVWRQVCGGSRESREPILVSAWQGLTDTMAIPSVTSHQKHSGGEFKRIICGLVA